MIALTASLIRNDPICESSFLGRLHYCAAMGIGREITPVSLGVLIAHLDITANNEFMRRTPDISTTEALDLGIMYELRRNDINQNTVNVIRPFSTASAEWRLFSAKYIGRTEMVHEEIEVEAMRITKERPNYELFENNCQSFAKYLVELMCPGCLTPDTIQIALQRWQNCTAQPSGRIPGAYPASLVTIVSSPDRTFVIAEETVTHRPISDREESVLRPPPSVFSFDMTERIPTETDLQIESASMFGITDLQIEKWSDVWRRRELARAFNVHGYFDGWVDLAKAFEREGNYDLAIKVWERALEKHPTSKWAEQELAGVYDKKATHGNPIEIYEKDLEHHPTSETLCARVCNSLTATRQFDRVIRVLHESLKCFSLNLSDLTENLRKALGDKRRCRRRERSTHTRAPPLSG